MWWLHPLDRLNTWGHPTARPRCKNHRTWRFGIRSRTVNTVIATVRVFELCLSSPAPAEKIFAIDFGDFVRSVAFLQHSTTILGPCHHRGLNHFWGWSAVATRPLRGRYPVQLWPLVEHSELDRPYSYKDVGRGRSLLHYEGPLCYYRDQPVWLLCCVGLQWACVGPCACVFLVCVCRLCVWFLCAFWAGNRWNFDGLWSRGGVALLQRRGEGCGILNTRWSSFRAGRNSPMISRGYAGPLVREKSSVSHWFCWIFLDGSQVRVRPACSPFTFFSPSAISPACPLTQVILL